MSENPYAPIDRSEGNRDGGGPGSAGSGLVDQEGKFLTVTSPARLPGRCIRSNRTDDLIVVSKPMYYVHPVTWLGLFLCGLPGVLILYLVLRKKIDLSYSINREERNSRRLKSVIGFIVFLGGIGLMVMGIGQGLGALVITGVVVMIAGLIGASVFSNHLSVVGHREGQFKLKGCCPAFLADAMAGVDNPYYDPVVGD